MTGSGHLPIAPQNRRIHWDQHTTVLAVAAMTAAVIGVTFVILWGEHRALQSNDQRAYDNLGHILARTGIFARSIEGGTIVPEPLRTIGYPLFLALLFRLFGDGYAVVAAAQVTLLAVLTLLVHQLARELGLERRHAAIASWAAALFLPFAYHGTLEMSDLPATVVFTAAITLGLIAWRRSDPAAGILAGVLFGYAALVRPALVVAGIVVGLAITLAPSTRPRRRRVVVGLLTLAMTACVAGTAVAYAWSGYGRVGLIAAPQGGVLWLGYWQGVLRGRDVVELQLLAVTRPSDDAIDTEAARLGLPTLKARRYVRGLERYFDVHVNKFTTLAGVHEYMAQQEDLLVLAVEDIRGDPFGWVWGGLTRRAYTLWSMEYPVPGAARDAITLPMVVVWAAQSALIALAAVGMVRGIATQTTRWASLIGVIAVLAIAGAYFPFYSEQRYSLPAKPLLIVFSIVGIMSLTHWLATSRVLHAPRRASKRQAATVGGRACSAPRSDTTPVSSAALSASARR